METTIILGLHRGCIIPGLPSTKLDLVVQCYFGGGRGIGIRALAVWGCRVGNCRGLA